MSSGNLVWSTNVTTLFEETDLVAIQIPLLGQDQEEQDQGMEGHSLARDLLSVSARLAKAHASHERCELQ